MSELAEIISVETDYKISKSGINHHFRKLKELVRIQKEKENKQ
jgi:DNA-binding transcriptional regulator WhiA